MLKDIIVFHSNKLDLSPPTTGSFDKKILLKEVAAPSSSFDETSQEPEVDIVINNVVASFNVRCHLNLRDIALRGLNVEYRRENGASIN